MEIQPETAELVRVYSQDELNYKYYSWDSETNSPPRVYQPNDVSGADTGAVSLHHMGSHRSPLQDVTPGLYVPTYLPPPSPAEDGDMAWNDDHNCASTEPSGEELPHFSPYVTDENVEFQQRGSWPEGDSVWRSFEPALGEETHLASAKHSNSSVCSSQIGPKRLCSSAQSAPAVNSINRYNRLPPGLHRPQLTLDNTASCAKPLGFKQQRGFRRSNSDGVAWNNHKVLRSNSFLGLNSQAVNCQSNVNNQPGVNSQSDACSQSGVKSASNRSSVVNHSRINRSSGDTWQSDDACQSHLTCQSNNDGLSDDGVTSLRTSQGVNTTVNWFGNDDQSFRACHLKETTANSRANNICSKVVSLSSNSRSPSRTAMNSSLSTPRTKWTRSDYSQSNPTPSISARPSCEEYNSQHETSTLSDKCRSTRSTDTPVVSLKNSLFGGKRLSFEIKPKETPQENSLLCRSLTLTPWRQSLHYHTPPNASATSPTDKQRLADSSTATTDVSLSICRKKPSRWSLPSVTSRKPLYLPGADASSTLPPSNDGTWISSYRSKHMVSKVPYIDSHCHLDFLFTRKRHNGSLRTYLAADPITAQTVPDNFAGCVAIFCDPTFWKFERRWKALLSEDNIWGAFGVHPKLSEMWNAETEARLREALKHPKVKALGEIGLDYSRGLAAFKEKQKEAFRSQIRIALELNLPLVIHCRDAEHDCYDIMTEMVPFEHKIHRHCFTEDWHTACRWFHHFPSLMIGLTPLVTFTLARQTHHVARMVPLERLLLETDSPYFIPAGVPKQSVPHSHPAMAIAVAVQVASLKGIPVDDVLHAALDNTRRLYAL